MCHKKTINPKNPWSPQKSPCRNLGTLSFSLLAWFPRLSSFCGAVAPLPTVAFLWPFVGSTVRAARWLRRKQWRDLRHRPWRKMQRWKFWAGKNCGGLFAGRKTGWWFQIWFLFLPYLEKIPNLTNIFQMGWNHQLRKPSPKNGLFQTEAFFLLVFRYFFERNIPCFFFGPTESNSGCLQW